MDSSDFLTLLVLAFLFYPVVRVFFKLPDLFREERDARRWLNEHPHLAGRDAPDDADR
jgi:hypothetical protein